jgi:hypothetical protein
MESQKRRLEMGLAIVEFEGRFKAGKLQVYKLPAGDGGGSYEIAGINDRYHAQEAAKLKNMIEGGRHDEALREAGRYIEEYTRPVLKFFPSSQAAEQNPAIEFVLRDTAFNRGNKGAATVLQLALGMQQIDGVVGPVTHREFARALAEPAELLRRLRRARETYERNTYQWKPGKRDEKSKFWAGLVNRWDKAHQVASSARFV